MCNVLAKGNDVLTTGWQGNLIAKTEWLLFGQQG